MKKRGKEKPTQLTRREFLRDAALFIGGAYIGSISLNSSCGPLKSAKSAIDSLIPAPAPVQTSTKTPARGLTGTITTGNTVAASTTLVPAGGGVLTVNKPGDPLDGMKLGIPPGAYPGSKQFAVSYAPVLHNSFGPDFNPITPLISVDNGGQFAGEMIEITIPVTIPDGSFAMGFIYDKTTKTLEGMPLLAVSADSITVGTCHFSDFIISLVPKINLKKDIDTHFRPRIDDWEFTNYGSYIAPGGHCAGQSISAMWYYYTQPDGQDLTLYGRYDNNGNKPATPNLWMDDSLGYRFVSVVQADTNWDAVNGIWFPLVDSISQENTWNAFAYTMQVTGEPQLVGMYSKAGGGHAMIVYRIKDGDMLVADPNYPGDTERIIYYGFGKFLPYSSGDTREAIDAGKPKQYETIMYAAKSSLVDFPHIGARWAELKNKTIGGDLFPGYKIVYINEKKQIEELTDGITVPSNKIVIGSDFNGTMVGVDMFRDGIQQPLDDGGAFTLNPGNNVLGIWIRKPVGTSRKYVDFKYLNVTYGNTATATPSLLALLQQTKTFNVSMGVMGMYTYSGPAYKNGSVSSPKYCSFAVGSESITWSGASFKGAVYGMGATGAISGDISGDGRTLASMTVTTEIPYSRIGCSVKISCILKNVPIQWMEPVDTATVSFHDVNSELRGAGLNSYVSNVEWMDVNVTSSSDPALVTRVFGHPDWSIADNIVYFSFSK